MAGIVQGMRALWDGYMFELDPSVVPILFNEKVLVLSFVFHTILPHWPLHDFL